VILQNRFLFFAELQQTFSRFPVSGEKRRTKSKQSKKQNHASKINPSLFSLGGFDPGAIVQRYPLGSSVSWPGHRFWQTRSGRPRGKPGDRY
jgi:hypothetical protein